MASLTISEVARNVGLRPSAIRYYERMGILLPPRRVSGQRRYEVAAVHQLAVLRRAQEIGFTLEEIRQLFFGFAKSTPISARWRELAGKKIIELDARIAQVRSMKDLLLRMERNCRCDTVERCGAGIVRAGAAEISADFHP